MNNLRVRRTWGILVLALIAAACTSTPKEPTTTVAEQSTSTTIAPAQRIALGSHPIDSRWCLDNWAKVRSKLRVYEDMPKAGAEGFEAWASTNPEIYTDICGIAYAIHQTDALLERVGDLFGVEQDEIFAEELSDVELVWCHRSANVVQHSADILGIGPDALLPKSFGLLADSRAADRLMRQGFEFWGYVHPDAYVRACKAAFGGR
jgi:hypothetical protein